MDIKLVNSINFKSKVPTNLKLTKSQYAIANAYTNKESRIVQTQYETLPTAIQAAMSLQRGDSNKFKTWDVLQKAFFDNDIIKTFSSQDETLFQKVSQLLKNNIIENFVKAGLSLEKMLFLLNPKDKNLQEQLNETFVKYNLQEINDNGDRIINQIKNSLTQNEELEILRKISTQNSKGWDSKTKNYAQFLSNVLNKLVPQAESLSTMEKASLFKLMSIVHFDVSNLDNKIAQKYEELINSTINKKELLNYADEPSWTTEQVNNFYLQNKYKILKSIILLDTPPLNSQLDHKIDKFSRTINIVDKISNDEQLTKLLYECNQKIKYPEDKIKLVELIKGFIDLKETDKLKTELDIINTNKKIDITMLNNLAKKYLTLLTNISNTNSRNVDISLIHTIPSAITRFNELFMPEYRFYLINLIQTISDDITDSKMNYLKFINNNKTEIGLANQDTNKQFLNSNLNFNTWINYNKKDEFRNNTTNENMSVSVWQRNVGYDLFQGNYSGICVATNGKNAFGSVDALLNTNVQIIEIKNDKKTIGNAYTYWATDPNSRLVFVIDGVTLDRKYQNDESIKQNLLRYAYKYAHDVKGDDDFLLYAGDHYNSISMDEYQFKTVPLQILGNTGNRKYYLDSLKNKKYVTIDGENTYLADVREIKI